METSHIHISAVKPGDTVLHNGSLMTVGQNNLGKDEWMGITLFGDSYSLGYKPVVLVTKISS